MKLRVPLWRPRPPHSRAYVRRPHCRRPSLEFLEQRRLLVGPAVDHVAPLANSHAAAVETDVSATYDRDIDPASVSNGTFAVHAMQSGQLLEPENVLSVDGGTVRLNPAVDLRPGELVQATATTGIRNFSGEDALAPHVWQFRAAVAGGSADLADTGQDLGMLPAIALGDLDGDGDLDAFTGMGVWWNGGQGAFIDSGQWLDNPEPVRVALGDIDGDGDLDGFVANGYGESPLPNKIWVNDGYGVFSDSGQSLGNAPSHAVALGDLDGDGDLDAFVGNMGGDVGVPNRVWLNDGYGVFSDSGQSLGSLRTHDVALGDLDGDGDLDAYVANSGFHYLHVMRDEVWLNDGQGHFTDTGQSLGDEHSSDVELGDVDADGDLDAFIAVSDDPNVVWLNDGRGGFSDSGQQLGGQATYFCLALGDLDGDGDLDAFLEDIWLNDGQGAFVQSGPWMSMQSPAAALGDLDGDGDLDAVAAGFFASRVWRNEDAQVDLAISKTDGQVVAMPGGPLAYTIAVTNCGSENATGASVTDLLPPQLTGVTWTGVASPGSRCTPSGTGDIHDTIDLLAGGTITYTATGTVDPAATGTLTNRATVATAAGVIDAAPENNTDSDTDTLILSAVAGSGVFVDSGQELDRTMSFGVALGDLDGDGDLDAFVGNLFGGSSVWLNNGNGRFNDSGQRLGNSETTAVALGDLDGDGDLDAFAANGWGQGQPNQVWLNDGQGRFLDSGQRLGNLASAAVALGDLDGDGDLDAFVGNSSREGAMPNTVWLNNGQGLFLDSGQSLGNYHSEGVALGDLDGDGDLDAFVANDFGMREPNEVWLNGGQGYFVDTGQSLGRFLSMDVALGDLDGDGDLDAFIANSDDPNTVWLNNGQGQFLDSGQRLGGQVSSYAVALGDLDADGDLDAFVGNWSYGPDQVWLNDGQGIFLDSGQRLGEADTEDVALGDLDDDGDLDAVAVTFSDMDPCKVWLNKLTHPVLDAEPPETLGHSNTLSWSEVPGAEAYYIEMDDDPDFGLPEDQSGWISGCAHTFSGLISGETYYYRVKAREAISDAAYVESDWSDVESTMQIAGVFGRHVFYNNCRFDGNDSAAGPEDDQAIAFDKLALMPGQTAGFANYTSYSRGINGLMVDIAGLTDTPTASDFLLKVGNSSDPLAWQDAPQPQSISVRPGAGFGGSDRVTLLWNDYAIQKQWLQVTVLATVRTGLDAADVFYFGNAVAEAGNSTADAKVNATDMLLARNNPRAFLNPAPIDFLYDYNRDARVNATDMLLARNNQTHFLNALRLIEAPPPQAASSEASTAEESRVCKTDWAYEIERAGTKRRPAREDDPARAAADRLLTTDPP
ncbi:MAG: VCBS repeat-containing protein [Pirellulales bacterium]|nr:VCBS repeat-containing protein [Pirellulales bacterium]